MKLISVLFKVSWSSISLSSWKQSELLDYKSRAFSDFSLRKSKRRRGYILLSGFEDPDVEVSRRTQREPSIRAKVVVAGVTYQIFIWHFPFPLPSSLPSPNNTWSLPSVLPRPCVLLFAFLQRVNIVAWRSWYQMLW